MFDINVSKGRKWLWLTQVVSYGEKEPKQKSTEILEIKDYLEIWLLRIIPLVKSELSQPFPAVVFQPQTHLPTLETSITFSFSLQLWCTLCSHSRTNTTVFLFFSFSVINRVHPQTGEAIRHIFKGMSQQALLRTWCSCLFKWIIHVTAKLGKQPKSSQENRWQNHIIVL